MAAVTQSIPSYIAGVSQEPDVNMRPGYLTEIKNGYPDSTFGLQKRPGGKLENIIVDTSSVVVDSTTLTGAYWFSIIKDNQPAYFGCVVPAAYSGSTLTTLGAVRIWNSTTGIECSVTYDASSGPGSLVSPNTNTTRDYLTSSKADDYKIITIDKTSTLLNRTSIVTASTTNTPGTTPTAYSNFGNLPTSPSVNDIAQIKNSENTEKDDYYLKWDGTSWVEVAKPGISDGFNNWTAPHSISNTAENTFVVREANYSDRLAGDDNTMPQPSFVNTTIQDVFFYFNRVGFLSQDNVILSASLRPEYTNALAQDINFFSKSAQISIASDPIDLNAASVRAVSLYSVQPSRAGLVLFGNGEQFFLYAEQGTLSPLTAEVKSVSTYEVDQIIPVVELGDEIYFISKTPRYTRVFRMMNRGTEETPVVEEVSKIVQEYVPSTINNVRSNTQNQLVGLSSKDENYVWFYRQFLQNGERALQSWFRWYFLGKVLTFNFFTDNMYAVIELTDNKVAIIRMSLNKDPDGDLLTSVVNPNPTIHPVVGIGPNIDLWTNSTNTPTYDIPSNKTTIPLPANYPALAGSTYKPIVILSESASGSSSTVSTQAGTYFNATIDGTNFKVDGDLTSVANKIVIGYKYDMELKLPTTYFRNQNGISDFTASLVISRYKFSFASTGLVTFKISGYSSYDANYAVLNPQFYPANSLPVYDEVTFDLPLHMRNEFFDLTIFSDTPFPSSLMRMDWEGNYNPRYFRRT